jgi:hypothetical protein
VPAGTTPRSAFFIKRLEDAAAAGVDIPVPRVTNATPISHTIVAAATAILIRLDPIRMLSPFLSLMSLDSARSAFPARAPLGSGYYTHMRNLAWLLFAGSTLLAQTPAPSPPATAGQGPTASAATKTGPAYQASGTMSELMIKILYPTSDAVFYITTRTPKTDEEWGELQGKTMMLAESANLMMLPGRARDQDRWMQDSKLLLDAGIAAFKAAKRKDVDALDALNDQLYASCVTCHQHYRPNYGRGRGGFEAAPANARFPKRPPTPFRRVHPSRSSCATFPPCRTGRSPRNDPGHRFAEHQCFRTSPCQASACSPSPGHSQHQRGSPPT